MSNKENNFNLSVGYNVSTVIIMRELMFRLSHQSNKRGLDLWVGISVQVGSIRGFLVCVVCVSLGLLYESIDHFIYQQKRTAGGPIGILSV